MPRSIPPCHNHKRPLVTTKYGQLQGVTVPIKETSRTVNAFYGVPFAKPPVGPLRFADPKPPEPWSSVMTFIHGGGLVIWSASMFDGSALSALEDIVVVSIQYRLGVLGFYRIVQSMFDHLSGSGKILAIALPLQELGRFQMLVLSPLSKGLFHRAIAESGAITMPDFVVSKPEDLIFRQNVTDCLKKKSEEELMVIAEAMGMLPLPVRVDGVFLPKPVEEMLADREINKVPIIIGMNTHELGWLLPLMFNITGISEGMTREAAVSILQNLPILGPKPKAIPFAIDEYLGDTDDSLEIRDCFLDLLGDTIFAIPALRIAKSHRGPATDAEKALSRNMMRYWANFARTGDPNSPGLTTWPPYGADEHYLEINLQQKVSSKLKEEKFKFWTEILPEKIRSLEEDGSDHIEL
ncbi:hypothetical protein GDO78_020153 [Eleutherodactylus coqui]|uniref:Carboxylesterase type B domain-containing protein n=1 Tax=Eleutherodactylus coqui TaxID=57060 RepID=A0A8J6JTL9_ELECQ|nr:hypothetical protein GDO78_020153 [Eleutherodactylus coqui]